MAVLIVVRNFIEWFGRIIKKGLWLSAAIPYLLDFIAAYIPAEYVPPPIAKYAESGITLQWSLVLLSVGIFISVYLVHRDTEIQFNRARLDWEEERELLLSRVAELKATEANITLRVIEKSFNPSFSDTKPFSDAPIVNAYGFTDAGLPGWASLWARIEAKNIGREAGSLAWKLDEIQTIIPKMFIIVDSDEPGKPDYRDIGKRDDIKIDRIQYVKIAPSYQTPQVFAEALHNLSRYNFVFRYRTKSITGLSEPQFLSIAGEFREFREKILEYWRNHDKFQELVEIAEKV